MAISPEFMDAVNNNNGLLTRIMLKDSMVVDPTLEQYNERIKYASAHMSDLFDLHDGEKLNYDVSAWTKNYMNQGRPMTKNIVFNLTLYVDTNAV